MPLNTVLTRFNEINDEANALKGLPLVSLLNYFEKT